MHNPIATWQIKHTPNNSFFTVIEELLHHKRISLFALYQLFVCKCKCEVKVLFVPDYVIGFGSGLNAGRRGGDTRLRSNSSVVSENEKLF